MILTLPNGSIIEGRTGDNPDNLFGDAIVRGVVDEASRLKELSWHAIRTTLTQTQGHLRIVGNPKGKKNWFYRLCQMAKDSLVDKTQFSYHHLYSTDNPYVNPQEVELAKHLLPRHVFEELYLGIAQDDIAGVFTNIRSCIKDTFAAPIYGESYYMGLDLAKHSDFTVISILNQKKELVYFERFNQLDWGFQKKKIESIAQRYNNAEITMDSTGIGDPIYDDLKERGLSVVGLKFTNESKKRLIEGLSIAIQEQHISFPDIPDLLSELDMFEYQITPAGNVTYSAPEGYNDDCVVSLALANMCIESGMKLTLADTRNVAMETMEAITVTRDY